MKIALIHGQSHKGSTYHIAHMLTEKLGGEVTEFFLPKDFSDICCGCTTCILKSEKSCPHYERLKPLTDALLSADVIILASPVYVYHATGAMKVFLDHYGYMWMVHRPELSMFKKQGVCISTAAGAGVKSTNKDMKDSLFWWGTAKQYSIGMAVSAMSWEKVSEKKMKKLESATSKVAEKIKKRNGNAAPGFKTRFIFNIMKGMQKKLSWNEADTEYWKRTGLLEKRHPWKDA